MIIWDSLVDKILEHPKLRIEYGGCHAPHNDTPLYGRHAYWRLYVDDINFFAKITARVRVLEPREETLRKLLRAELKRRIQSITESVETDHYGQVYVVKRDPCSIRGILGLIEHQYIDLIPRKAVGGAQ